MPPRTRVQFLNTATRPPLGADTWIHVAIMRLLDRSAFEPHAACATGPAGRPTPTYAALRDVPDLEIVPVDLGPEVSDRSTKEKLLALLATTRAVAGIVRLLWHVRRLRIPIIHTSDRPRDAFVAVVVGRLTGATSIVHCHQVYNPYAGRLLRWSFHHADVLIAVSEYVAQTYVEQGIPPERVRVVLNAIDVDAWEPERGRDETRAGLGLGPDTPVLLSVCRLFPQKGVAELVKILPAVLQELPDTVLLVVGTDITGGRFTIELDELIARLGVAEHVRFLGRRDDIPGLMAASDVYAMPSHGEPFGLVFAEAMAMRRPVVALDHGGTREVVVHGRTGLLSAPDDLGALTDNVLTLLRDPSRRAEMGAAGRRHVQQCFTTTRMATDAAAVYTSIA